MTISKTSEGKENIFWADQSAQEIVRARKTFTIATGITPSGEIHIGNLREVATGDAVCRALKSVGKTPKIKYIADSFDPLRRVYPFLDEKKYAPHIGKPLSEIPCPCEKHESYAEHYLEPFLQSLDRLDIQVEIIRADRLYKEGKYVKNTLRSLENNNQIRTILREETGKKTEDSWSAFNPICEKCGKITGTKMMGFDAKSEVVHYRCECGDEGSASLKGGGKLTWRVDWPARWEILGITIEPFGKDHSSKGGSYDTGVRIAREIFNYEPPFPIVYEWISLKGGGDMSSSKGNVISIHEMLKVLPAEVLKYAVVKVRPNRRIVFDPGLPLLQLIDEFDDTTSKNHHARAAQLATISGSPATEVPFRHIVSLIQTTQDNPEEVFRILRRTGFEKADLELVKSRSVYAREWLERFAPDEVRFNVQSSLPASASDLSSLQKKALGSLGNLLKSGLTAEEIHILIYQVKDDLGIEPQKLFQAIYRSLLGKERGPRAGFFLASLDSEFVKKRFKEVEASGKLNPDIS